MPAAFDIDWLVISLKRTPERLRQFTESNAHQRLAVETLEAVDGLLLDRETLINAGLMTRDLNWSPGALGLALSHRATWQHAVARGRIVGVFEDDVLLRRDFATQANDALRRLPAGWDLLHFGYNTDSVLEIEAIPGLTMFGQFGGWRPSLSEGRRFVQVTDPVLAARLSSSFGTSAYAVSPQGAQKLLDRCFPLEWRYRRLRAFDSVLQGQGIDAVMNSYYEELLAYVMLPPIALALNDKATSTVEGG